MMTRLKTVGMLTCMLLMAVGDPASAVQGRAPVAVDSAPQVALVTFGPGKEIWARFGHNAIRIQRPASSTEAASDLLYNFGYFDLDEAGFYWRYARGIMRYYAVPEETTAAFAYYRRIGRSIREQALAVEPAAARQLAADLYYLTRPATRSYDYDYFYNNCSTRVRDLLDQALGKRLEQAWSRVPAETTLRREALRMVQDNALMYLGLQLGLGRSADIAISQWHAAFLPEILAAQIADFDGADFDGADFDGADFDGPALLRDEQLASGMQAADRLHPYYPQFAVLGLITVLIILLPSMLASVGWSRLGARSWLLLSGLAGLVLLLLWCCSDHQAAWRNENILLLLPSNLLLLRFSGGMIEKLAVWLLALGILTGAVLKFLPGAQFNTDLLFWLLPAQLAVWYFWHSSMRENRIEQLQFIN